MRGYICHGKNYKTTNGTRNKKTKKREPMEIVTVLNFIIFCSTYFLISIAMIRAVFIWYCVPYLFYTESVIVGTTLVKYFIQTDKKPLPWFMWVFVILMFCHAVIMTANLDPSEQETN